MKSLKIELKNECVMKDMLVRLYELPETCVELDQLKNEVDFRRPLAAEKYLVEEWVEQHFGRGWRSEVEVSFSRVPISTFIAIKDQEIIGFCTYDAAYLNFLGPMGVMENARLKGLGKSLLYLALCAMRAMGYAYAIIGGVGPEQFYANTFGAEVISGSDPGIYKGILSYVPV